jgi:hypothetical protein
MFIFLYENISYIGVTYVNIVRIRHGVVEVFALLGYLGFGYRRFGKAYRCLLSRVEQFKTLLEP